MQMHFESIEEFNEMAAAMGYVKRADFAPVCAITPAELSAEVLRQTADAVEPVSPGIAQETAGNEPAPTGQPETSEPAKRKRRTKAEMEAARAAGSQVENGSATEQGSISGAAVDAGSGNPFEAQPSAATQAILNAPTGQAATLAGIAAMQANPFEPAPEQSLSASPVQTVQVTATTVGDDPAAFIEARSLEILTTAAEPLTAVKHMHVCRDFIAKHGQAKYMESFPLAGLPATVATFKAEQCAKHQAALEFLNT